jgi:uncharacterized protein with PQ loop repeat
MSRVSGLHHKRKSKVAAPMFDKVVMLIAFVEPLTTFGQIYQLYQHKDPRGNSLFSWGFFVFSASIWLAYGIRIKNKPVIVGSALWIITESIVIFQILHYSHYI